MFGPPTGTSSHPRPVGPFRDCGWPETPDRGHSAPSNHCPPKATSMPTVIPPTIDIHLSPSDLRNAMEEDVRAGLTTAPKQLPPVYFYDDRGSRLFDDITRLDE